jgi:hypothetical protein
VPPGCQTRVGQTDPPYHDLVILLRRCFISIQANMVPQSVKVALVQPASKPAWPASQVSRVNAHFTPPTEQRVSNHGLGRSHAGVGPPLPVPVRTHLFAPQHHFHPTRDYLLASFRPFHPSPPEAPSTERGLCTTVGNHIKFGTLVAWLGLDSVRPQHLQDLLRSEPGWCGDIAHGSRNC